MNNGDVINRLDVVRKYNPHLNNVDAKSPLTVGNGRFCFTADVTDQEPASHQHTQRRRRGRRRWTRAGRSRDSSRSAEPWTSRRRRDGS